MSDERKKIMETDEQRRLREGAKKIQQHLSDSPTYNETAHVLLRNLEKRVKTWRNGLQPDQELQLLVLFAGGYSITADFLVAEGQHGIWVMGADEKAFTHQAVFQAIIKIVKVEPQAPKKQIGFTYDPTR